MAAVNPRSEYDFDMFVTHARSRSAAAAGNAAPQRRPAEPAPDLKVVPKKTERQVRAADRKSVVNAAIILFFAAAVLGLLCLQISAGARSYEISRQIAAVEQEIEVAKSENVRLNSELNGITGIGKIDDYATRVLGMTKVESYQVEYIDLSQDDGVIYASNGGFLSIFRNR